MDNERETNTPHTLTGNGKYYIVSSTTGTVTILTETGFGIFVAPELEPGSLALYDESTQKHFLRNIYMILLTQLLFTTGIISIFAYHQATAHVLENKEVLLTLSLFVNIMIVIVTSYIEESRRKHPINLVVLIIFTCTMSLFFGIATSCLKGHYLFLMITALMAVHIFAVIIYLIQRIFKCTPWRCGGVVFIISLIALGVSAGIVHKELWVAAVAILVAFVFSSTIIFEGQRNICGWHKYEFKPKEYTFAALALYFESIDYLMRFSRLKKGSPVLVLPSDRLPAALRNA